MSRRKPELQNLDISLWPSVAWTELDTSTREVVKVRVLAIGRFAAGEPVRSIEQTTGVNRRQLYRWLERAWSPHPDGRIFGFRAVLTYVRVKEYARTSPITLRGERGSRGTVGAFSQLLDRYPTLAAWLRAQINRRRLSLDQIHTDGCLRTRLRGVQKLHAEFLVQCRAIGLSMADYPFRSNWLLRMRYVNSMPEIVVAALLNRLRPSITFVLDLMWRWSCSIRLFRYFEDRTFVSSGSRPSTFISRTARCEAA
jgi:putative transposase